MKATELRIGNYYYYTCEDSLDERKKWCEVCQIDSQDLVLLESNQGDEDFNPIPLTEEWLLKFGFEKTKHSHGYACYIKDGFDFDIVSHGRYWVLAIYKDESCTDSLYFAHGRLEYVHQLQNLFFVFTGEELTIQTKSKLLKMFGKQK